MGGGRLAGGLSIGGLAAITAREYARTYASDTGEKSRVEIEPLAGFAGIARRFVSVGSAGGVEVERVAGQDPTAQPGVVDLLREVQAEPIGELQRKLERALGLVQPPQLREQPAEGLVD